ncbi:17447_t:CDS:2, partial [Racocetra fulgida]
TESPESQLTSSQLQSEVIDINEKMCKHPPESQLKHSRSQPECWEQPPESQLKHSRSQPGMLGG